MGKDISMINTELHSTSDSKSFKNRFCDSVLFPDSPYFSTLHGFKLHTFLQCLQLNHGGVKSQYVHNSLRISWQLKTSHSATQT